MAGRRKKKNQTPPPEGNFDLLFLQLMMIMMAFFILLSSLAVIVEEKRLKALNSLAGAFNLMPAGANLSKGRGQSIPSQDVGATTASSIRTAKELTRLAKELGLGEAMHALPLDKNSVLVRLSERITFQRGGTELDPRILPLLARLAELLKGPEIQSLTIEGHTDNIPIRSRRYASNWELSAARAMRVFQWFAEHGIPRNIMTVAGMGDSRPLSREDRSMNRRVELLIRFHPTTSKNTQVFSPADKPKPALSGSNNGR